MPHTAAEADRLARQAAFLGALAAIGALLLAVLGWAGGAVAMWMGVTARRRG
ncbi:hypothetical protein GTW08_12010, partial [Pseudonocardia sp. SID8383]|nr:hypothetical protein [Pseudonocardia sp. SID8383]